MHLVNLSLSDIFHALSDSYRVRIMRLLLTSSSEICLCELSDSLNEPEYKLSRHVKILKQTGLITSVRDGKWIYHGLVNKPDYLKKLHQAILLFPDASEKFQSDLKRFKKRMKLRKDGRCRIGSQIKPFIEERA